MLDESEGRHPAPEHLMRFALGDLGLVEAAEIEDHVAVCDECCRTVLDQADDELVTLVRESAPTGAGNGVEAVGTKPANAGTTLVAPPAVEVPVELIEHPKYRIIRRLGSGGMGTVYQAEHRMMKKMVAVKVVNRELIGRADLIERFHVEVRAAARLAHPNIVIAHDAEQAGEVHFLVMEFVEGMDLARLVAERGKLPVARASDYAWQAALGLQHACDRGIVHRDIKPRNLMVTPEGRIKILDFGLARFAREVGSEVERESRADPSVVTATGMFLGTADYIAPEQADDPHTADIRADIYSLGCTLYYLLSGRPPFPDGSVVQKLKAHAHRDPPPLDQLRQDVPPQLIVILARMMAKDPDLRFQTPGEAATALAPFANPKTLASSPAPADMALPTVSAPLTAPTEIGQPKSSAARRRLRYGILGVAAIGTAAALIALVFIPRGTPTPIGKPPDADAAVHARKGWQWLDQRDEEGITRALQEFVEASRFDPDYAPAWAGQAACYNLLADYGWIKATVAFPKAKAAAEEALKLDPECAEAHAALGLTLYSFELDWGRAEKELLEAIRLKPEYAEAHHWYAWYLAQLGRFPEAREEMKLAMTREITRFILDTNLGKIDYYSGDYDAATERLLEVLAIHPDYKKAIHDLALAYEQQAEQYPMQKEEHYSKAIQELNRLGTQPITQEDTRTLGTRGRIYAKMGKKDEAQKILNELLNRRATGPRYVSPVEIATVYEALGDRKTAFSMLQAAWDERDARLAYLKVDPRLNPMRKDPGFAEHLKRAHLDDEDR